LKGIIMRYFITGASGWIGSAVTRELLASGHQVSGLARSDASAAAVAALGADVVRGSLTDLDVLRDAATASDGVVHLGFIHDFSAFETSITVDRAAIETLGAALAGSGKALAIASGVAGLTPGRPVTEDDEGEGEEARLGNAKYLLSLAGAGVKPLVLRFAPSVHGIGDHGFISTIAQIAREKGVSAYVGDGSSRWAAVQRDDAARLVRLALESPDTAGVVHAVGEEGVPARKIAEAIAARTGIPVVSIAPEQTMEHFGWMGRFFGQDLPATSVLTQQRYGWSPTAPSLIDDIAAGGYDEGVRPAA
jgi:nucleoside-diphosphate-sugar epimerase